MATPFLIFWRGRGPSLHVPQVDESSFPSQATHQPFPPMPLISLQSPYVLPTPTPHTQYLSCIPHDLATGLYNPVSSSPIQLSCPVAGLSPPLSSHHTHIYSTPTCMHPSTFYTPHISCMCIPFNTYALGLASLCLAGADSNTHFIY